MNVGIISSLYSQEHEQDDAEIHESDKDHDSHKKHLISASINHTIIFSGVKEGTSSNISLPSFGLNYTYWFNHQWAIGLHNDVIIEDFVVKQSTSKSAEGTSTEEEINIIDRGTPISSAIMVIYKPVPFLGIMAGAGREFSSHEDYTVIRFGLETPFHLPHNWELFGTLTYDINIDAYQSLSYGIGIGKTF